MLEKQKELNLEMKNLMNIKQNNNNKIKNNNNFCQTDFNWLIYEHNSCRYEVLASKYFFCIYEFMIKNIENQNTYLKTFNEFILR